MTFSLENDRLMDALKHYSIPIQGLANGIHNFDFEINEAFFSHFEHSPVGESNIKARIELNRRPEVMDITFHIDGTVLTPCDRCLTDIHLPIQGSFPMLVKDAQENEEDVDVIYISLTQRKLLVAQYIYEYVLLSIPIIKAYDCEEDSPRPCDDTTLDKFSSNQNTDADNPFKDQLQNFKDN